MYRRYNIRIEVDPGVGCDLSDISPIAGCSISEPSNWVVSDNQHDRGLTFLDRNGKEVESEVLRHQKIFHAAPENGPNEEEEISSFLRMVLREHYLIDEDHVRITVSAYNRL